MKKGFTIAETLIALGVVGVVAAMTLPAIIKNYQKQLTVNQLKKMYSDIMAIHNRAVNDYGEPSDWDYPQFNYAQGTRLFLEKYYIPYLNNSKYYTASDIQYKLNYYIKNTLDGNTIAPESMLILSDGRLLGFYPTSAYMWILSDLNGLKGPNRAGRDVFVLYQYCTLDKACGGPFYMPRFASGYCDKITDYRYNGWACGKLIHENGWKIKDNYPW